MDNSLIINIEHHRSRERVKDLGEVFTPEKFVKEMMDLYDPKVWSEENTTFFEPSCGHGNIVIPVLAKRLTALHKKYTRLDLPNAKLRATANALNTLWAIDICPKNVELTKKRILDLLLKEQFLPAAGYGAVKRRDFLAHVLCALDRQIHENEALSALSVEENAATAAAKTNLGHSWFRKNGHRPIDFAKTWAATVQDNRDLEGERIFLEAKKFVTGCQSKTRFKSKSFGYASAALSTLFTDCISQTIGKRAA